MSSIKRIPREELCQLYIKERLSIKELAEYYNVREHIVVGAIYRARKKNPKLFPYVRNYTCPCPDIEQIKELYTKKNKSAGQIAIRFGVDTGTVYHWIEKERKENPESFPQKAKENTRPSAEELRMFTEQKQTLKYLAND